jgi:hypothetical protein
VRKSWKRLTVRRWITSIVVGSVLFNLIFVLFINIVEPLSKLETQRYMYKYHRSK